MFIFIIQNAAGDVVRTEYLDDDRGSFEDIWEAAKARLQVTAENIAGNAPYYEAEQATAVSYKIINRGTTIGNREYSSLAYTVTLNRPVKSAHNREYFLS